MSVSIESMVERWSGLDRPLFKGRLIDGDGCKCAQGDVLSCAGFTDDQLRSMTQDKADGEVAAILGISRTHAVLLRNVNDKVGGAPQLVLSDPAQVVGSKAPYLLAFWLHLDGLSDAAWAAARDATRAAAWAAARAAARDAARAAARAAAGDAAWAAAWDAARDAARAAAWNTAWAAAWNAAGDAAWDAARAAARAAAGDAARDAAGDAAWAAAWDATWNAAWVTSGTSSEIQGMDKLEADGRKPYFLAFFGFTTWDAVRALVK
jgi:hypothetical protein